MRAPRSSRSERSGGSSRTTPPLREGWASPVRRRERAPSIGLDAALAHKNVAAGRHKDRVDDEVGEYALPGQAATLSTIAAGRACRSWWRHVEVGDDGADLGFDHVGIEVVTALTPRVFWAVTAVRRGRGVHAKGVQRADVGLNSGSTTGVRSSDSQGDDGLHPPTLISSSSVRWVRGRPLSRRLVQSSSRLVVGTGGFRSLDVLEASLVASDSSIATVALRRVDPKVEGSIYDLLTRLNVTLLPNTAGCFSAEEAVKVAELAREAFATPLVKLEVIGDDVTLLPDTTETLSRPPRAGAAGLRGMGVHLR